jgi:hypothetical protein
VLSSSLTFRNSLRCVFMISVILSTVSGFLLPWTPYNLKSEAEMSSATSVAKANPEIALLRSEVQAIANLTAIWT